MITPTTSDRCTILHKHKGRRQRLALPQTNKHRASYIQNQGVVNQISTYSSGISTNHVFLFQEHRAVWHAASFAENAWLHRVGLGRWSKHHV
jgi:hypothetical protein